MLDGCSSESEITHCIADTISGPLTIVLNYGDKFIVLVDETMGPHKYDFVMPYDTNRCGLVCIPLNNIRKQLTFAEYTDIDSALEV